MSNLLVMKPLAIAALTGNGSGLASLLSPDPREAWTAPSGATASFTIDLGAQASFDTLYLGYAALSQAATITLAVDGGAATTVAFALPKLASRPAHGLIALAAPVTGRSLAVTITLASADQPFRAGVVMVGLSFRPVWAPELGGGRTVIDTGTRDRLQLGGFSIDPGMRKASWQWTLGDLSDDELATLYALVLDRGETQAMLVVESIAAGTGLCERIHYGTFDRLEQWERRDVGLTRWSLRVEDWL